MRLLFSGAALVCVYSLFLVGTGKRVVQRASDRFNKGPQNR
jgi:hypothetical protein